MVGVNVFISTNASDIEKQALCVPRDAIDEFSREGFATNTFDGRVIFNCAPRVINPDLMQIFIDLREVGETVIVWSTIIGAIIKFCKKCKGYEQVIFIDKKKRKEEIHIRIPINEDSNVEDIIKEINKLLK